MNAAKTLRLGEATGIKGVNADEDDKPVEIYDLSGRRLNSMQQGLNIVKTVDGRTSKIIVK